MDIKGFTTGLTLAKSAVDLVGSVTDLIADPSKREAARYAVEQSKKAFEIAEIQAAESLGHPLCHCDWPSSICVESPQGYWKCRRCGKIWAIEDEGSQVYIA